MTMAGSSSSSSVLDSLNFLRRPILSTALSGSLSSSSAAVGTTYSSSSIAEEKVVLDIGTHYIRAGFSGDHAPNVTTWTWSPSEALGGDELLEARLLDQLRDMYRRTLLVDARTRKVAVVESALMPAGLRLSVARILFCNLRVPQVSFYPSAVTAMMTCGAVAAGLVVDCGHRLAVVTPVCEARALLPYSTSTPVAGSAMFSNLHALLEEFARFTPFSSEEDVECFGGDVLDDSVVLHIMTRLLWASPVPPPLELRGGLGVVGRNGCEVSSDLVSFYESSSTCSAPSTKMTVDSAAYGRGLLVFPSWIRERAAEPLFCGDPLADHQSIPDAIVQSIERVPVDIRKSLVSRILVTGGVADMPGFRHRLMKDVVERLQRDARWSPLAAHVALADGQGNSESPFAPSERAWVGASLAVAAKIGTSEVSREDFDGVSLPDWTAVTQ
ncbi:hypothetical protein IWW38_002342 [Coemansia aciculifera]|uniref:Uncharacterized protein n=1 Tax=Coemansia aciculifera TaxID=417176 RepID=A0ACC1M4G1_9FUNG|nr:hypothetical protein IWW38_002342 [Coemansia aciculifera]